MASANRILKVKNLLSKIELEFLKSPESFNANYVYGIRHRLNRKVKALNEEIGLLQKSEFLNLIEISKNLTENCKIYQENNNTQPSDQGLNQSALSKIRAPRMGFEPMRTRESTGSQGPRVNHSATSALTIQLF